MYYSGPPTEKLLVLNGAQDKALHQLQAALLLGPPDPMILEVSVVEKDAIWSLWQPL